MSKFFRKIYRLIDGCIVVPISRVVYNLQNKVKTNAGLVDKILNRPTFLIVISLILAVIFFVLVDSKVLLLVNNNAEVITKVPVSLKYNEEAFVVEGAPETVDIILTGRKNDIYLAKQLGEFEVSLDLTDYEASEAAYKVYFTYSKNIDNLSYKLDPSYVSVIIKNKVSNVSSVTYELINQDKLDPQLSVKSVALSKSEVVVKGSETALEKIAWIKALVDLGDDSLTEAGSYDLDNVLLVAYDNTGNILNNVEIVPKTLSATVVLDSYSKSIPIEVKTLGTLKAGKSIASILMNNQKDFSVTIYGNEADIENIKSIPVVVNIDGFGAHSVKSYNVTLTKPSGVRSMSTTSVGITLTFGDEKQKTFTVENITNENIGKGLTANIISSSGVDVICKGVSSVIDNVQLQDIKAYVDLSKLGVGDHEVDVQISNSNPLLKFEVSSKITVRISKE